MIGDRDVLDDFKRGAEAAAAAASSYDATSAHPYRLGDCILGKLNLRRGTPRRNKTPIEDPATAWVRGFATGLAEMHRLLIHGNDSAGLCRVAAEAKLTIALAKAARVSTYDIKELRKAGLR